LRFCPVIKNTVIKDKNMQSRPCDCEWDECDELRSYFERYGNMFQRGVFQIRRSQSKKSLEFFQCMQNHIGPLPARERILIANYHWNSNLMEFMTNEKVKRTTPIKGTLGNDFIEALFDGISSSLISN
jgi:hypothetical protein